MAGSLNLHRVFAGTGGYLEVLRVPDEDKDALREAREKIRAVLRGAFRNWHHHVTRVELLEGSLARSAEEVKLPRPKFRLQGSFAYFTVNDVQHEPPQQIDQDDGVFLPIGFVAGGGSTHPKIVATAYFKLVEEALRPLCVEEGWKLNPKRPKDTCVRIEISCRTHIDLPLYAIQDDAFARLRETAVAKSFTARMAMDDGNDLFDEVYRGLTSAEIMLAHRTEGWIESDPRKLENWFDAAVSAFGPQVRRLSRAYKGMRDAEWPDCGLRSICIMAALVTALEKLGRQDDARDDLALMKTAREMVNVFRNPIENPVFPGDRTKYLCDGWTPEYREEVRSLFLRAADELEAAITGTVHKQVALRHLKTAFGPLIPDDPDLISFVNFATAIRSEPSAPQPKPMPVRTKSG